MLGVSVPYSPNFLSRKLEYKEGLICKYETAGQVLATMRMLISGHLNVWHACWRIGLAKGWRRWDRVLRLVGRLEYEYKRNCFFAGLRGRKEHRKLKLEIIVGKQRG